MKRFLALAALVLGMVSCQTEPEGLDVIVGGEVDTVVTVTIPEAETRANSAEGAFVNVVNSTDYTIRYIFAVYYGETCNRQVKYSDDTSVAFDVRLVPDRDYQFVVWADVVAQEGVDLHYNTSDLMNITLKEETWVAMDETRDAFTGTLPVDDFNGSQGITVELTRPFAKLRVVTTDFDELAKFGITATTATVSYTTSHRVAFNAYSGVAADATSDNVSHEYTIVDYDDNADEDTIFVDYFFAGANDVVKFNLAVYEDAYKTKLIKANSFNTDIPVKRNFLTTIKGNVLTDGNNIKVEVEDGFENAGGTDPDYEHSTISSAAEFYAALEDGGNYIVTSNFIIDHAYVPTPSTAAATRNTTKTTVIDLNGMTITVKNDTDENFVEDFTGILVISGEGLIENAGTGNGALIDNENGTVNVTGSVTIEEDVTTNEVVNHVDSLKSAFANGGELVMAYDITLDEPLTLDGGKVLVLDLNGKTIKGKTTGKVNPQDLFLVKGNLTVKNGTITVEHTGENMGWGGQGTIFNITAGGVVTLNGVTAKHLGGTDMNFVAHLNNWGTATFNANNSTLEATYITVRAFNSGPDMNNVKIENSTLKGKYCFWVHNYNEAGDNTGHGGGTDATLNVDICNGTNTFECTGKAPILYGFNEPLYFNAEGKLLAFSAADMAKFIGENSQRSEIALANDIECNESFAIAKDFTLDLNGKTIAGTDETTGSFGLITNRGNLIVKNGTMTLVATNDRDWNAYSSVISNNPGGNLVVEDVTIEHFGGTDMAYGIDNLTNGKGTSAVANINEGAVVKSTYRAVRMFLNGVEANNSLTVNDGAVIESTGGNKSIWMQDPSANANTGTLVVNEGATLMGDAYLSVTAGSTEWPVSVKIADAAFAKGYTVTYSNVPEGYVVMNVNDVWTVKSGINAAIAMDEDGVYTFEDDMVISEPIVVEGRKMVIDLNGQTITAPSSCAFEAREGGVLTIKNGKVVAYESTVRAIGGKATIESGEYTSTGTALDSPATYRYSLDCREGGELIINGGTFKSNNGMINVGSTVTINGGKFENIVEKTMTRHFAYVSAPLTINDGEFYGKANSSAGGCFFCGAAAGCKINVNGGKFTSLWTSGSVNRIFELYTAGGTINVTGGMFNTNGGIATFVTENTDEATKAAYPYVAK